MKMFNLLKKLEFYPAILCLRFPFLYPRNRFTGTHWYWYWWREKAKKYYNLNIYYKKQEDKGDNTLSTLYYWLYNVMMWLHDYPFQLLHFWPNYCELDSMPEGWRKAFGIQMCKDIRKQLIKEHNLFSYRIMDIKEKWGYLHWYDACSSKEIQNIINKYANKSYYICINCGKPAKYLTAGWVSPYCENCFNHYLSPHAELVDGKWKYDKDEL